MTSREFIANKRNKLKGADGSDNPSHGSFFIEQAFSNSIN